MGDYHGVYLQTDVQHLEEVFQIFREMFHRIYGFERAKYITLPEVARVPLLKMTKVELELVLLTEKGQIRGGLSMVSKRDARATKPCVQCYYQVSQQCTSTLTTCTGGQCASRCQLREGG